MKNIIVLLALVVLAEVCAAKMVILKDGTTLDAVTLEDKGEVIEAVTRFGTLNINRSEIDNLAELGLAAKPAEAGPLTGGLEIITTQNPDGVVRVDYYSGRQKTGTHYFSAGGALLRAEGTAGDGDYREYFADGKVKREKTMIDGLNNGVSRSYYPDGTLQNEVYFINGRMNGAFKFYDRSGKLLQERSYVDGVASGYFREFNQDGSVKSRVLYVNGVPAGEKPPAREEPPVYRPEPPARAPAAPKAAGILSKPQTVFLTPEVFSVGGADKKWEENYEAGFDLIASIWDYTSGEFKSYPGFGVTFGVNLGAYKDSPGYIAFSYIKGPSAEIDMTFNDSVFGPGYYNEEVETSFMRFVGGYKFVSPIEGNSLFFIDLNGGFGRGKVESSYSENSFLGYYSGSASESWSGMTWSASPGIAWEYPGYILEFGVRYTVFPKLKDSDTFADISWRPFSLYLNFVF
ncbi:MAG: hypothetical protein RDU13_08220 [Elusimicrobiales bacterium]|nr:hypothetical protein [Elusimicrobiales bacterium]